MHFLFLLPYLVSQRTWKLPNSWTSLGFWTWLHIESSVTACSIVNSQPATAFGPAKQNWDEIFHSTGLEESGTCVPESAVNAEPEAAGGNSSKLESDYKQKKLGPWMLKPTGFQWRGIGHRECYHFKSMTRAQHMLQLRRQCCNLTIINGGAQTTPPFPKNRQTKRKPNRASPCIGKKGSCLTSPRPLRIWIWLS